MTSPRTSLDPRIAGDIAAETASPGVSYVTPEFRTAQATSICKVRYTGSSVARSPIELTAAVKL